MISWFLNFVALFNVLFLTFYSVVILNTILSYHLVNFCESSVIEKKRGNKVTDCLLGRAATNENLSMGKKDIIKAILSTLVSRRQWLGRQHTESMPAWEGMTKDSGRQLEMRGRGKMVHNHYTINTVSKHTLRKILRSKAT